MFKGLITKCSAWEKEEQGGADGGGEETVHVAKLGRPSRRWGGAGIRFSVI